MATLKDLADRPDLHLGRMVISPSRRQLQGSSGTANLPPLPMHVLMMLLDAGDRVVTRSELFDQAWGGAIAGDDSLNQVIAKIRRAARQSQPGFFEIETVPRTGYRLTGEILEHLEGKPSERLGGLSRRAIVGGAVATFAMAGGGYLFAQHQDSRRFAARMAAGMEALRLDRPDASSQFREAVALKPEDPTALGLLAYALAAGGFWGPNTTGLAETSGATDRARKALDIDPREPNALLAMAFVESKLLDINALENRFRAILSIAPHHVLTMRHLGSLLHGVGRCTEALRVAEQALARQPLNPDQWSRKALRLWVTGQTGDAVRVIDRANALWPHHPAIRLAQLMIFSFTGRPQSARQIIREEEGRSTFLNERSAAVLRASLTALEVRNSTNVWAARDVNIDMARRNPQSAAWAILMMAQLGELDVAFALADAFLLGRGPLSADVAMRPTGSDPASRLGNAWRNTFGLFTPPTLAMRLDARWPSLARDLGLTNYWTKRQIGPDAFLFRRPDL